MDIKVVEDLWSTNMLPEGIVERWFVSNGRTVKAGECVAEVRIEGALHEIFAPTGGRLTIVAAANDVIEPGSVLGKLDPVA